ncbi:unnamed protein product [Macrosiphum euphorbiae]|uniref:Exonuclease domain-containing protein n=1 Tax=Macrosiphum euphorbiae TaxID=13131 RepID=A0AAV0VWK2_9HEMI|nr:unnamed protein product [Macrosiphum euphorbiae]
MNKLNIVAIDFEFTTMERTSLVLISGAISNIHKQSPIIKLKGTPLLLRKNSNNAIPLDKTDINLVIRSPLKIFKNKEQKLTPILNELNDSFLTKFTNLQGEFIQNYLLHGNKIPIIITWNGQTDMEILNRLNIKHTFLSIRSYDLYKNGFFFLQISNILTKQIITQIELGEVHKNGRLLDLTETHNLICKQSHNNTYSHNPVTDIHFIHTSTSLASARFDSLLPRFRNSTHVRATHLSLPSFHTRETS